MNAAKTFHRRGIVEGFSVRCGRWRTGGGCSHSARTRGMNTYLYAPRRPLSSKAMATTLPRFAMARATEIDSSCTNAANRFRLRFSSRRGIVLRRRSRRWHSSAQSAALYDAGARTSPSCSTISRRELSDARDRRAFKNSLARAEGTWMTKSSPPSRRAGAPSSGGFVLLITAKMPLLERVFGQFEPELSRNFGAISAAKHPCFWTGPSVVSKSITLSHATAHRQEDSATAAPVGQLSGQRPVHARRVAYRPTDGHAIRAAGCVYGYLNNPSLQEELSFYRRWQHALTTPMRRPNYRAESSWTKIVRQRFGAEALPHWRALRSYAEASIAAKKINACCD